MIGQHYNFRLGIPGPPLASQNSYGTTTSTDNTDNNNNNDYLMSATRQQRLSHDSDVEAHATAVGNVQHPSPYLWQ